MGRCRRDRVRRRRVQQPERDLLTYTALSGNTAAASFHVIGVLCRSRISIGSLTLGAAGVLCLVLFAFPWSPSTQPSGFSVTLDLDDAAGDQAVSSLDLVPDQSFSIQIFGRDIQGATGMSARFGYDASQATYERFDPGDALPNVQAVAQQDTTSLTISVSSLSGSATANAGWVGTLRFRTTSAFSDTEFWLIDAELARGGQSETISPAVGVALQVAAPPSPDFDGNGLVGFSDFVAFAGAFGAQRGDGKYVAKYDLNNDGSIGFDDLLIFAESFGDAVNRAPVFGDGSSTSRTVAENTPARRPIQHPVNASDPDGHRVTYNLSSADSASFSVDTGSGQLRTLSGITYDFEDNDRYSVELVGSDPYGESATIGVTIHVADVNEPPEIPAAPLVQPASTTSLTVTWDAPDNTGPDITDYDVQIRKSGNFLPHSHDGPGTSATIIELDVNTRYEVQVRATNDEGTSEWSQSGEGRTNTTGPPGKPDPPTLTASFPLTLRIQWTAPENSGGTPIIGYNLQYGKDGGQLEEHFRVITDTQIRFRSQPPGTAFEIQVRAINNDGPGEWSDSAFGSVQPNRLPTFDEASPVRSFAENTEAGQNIGEPLFVTDDYIGHVGIAL